MRSSRAQAGFTLVEVLVALALVAIIMTFALGTIDTMRRAWAVTRTRERPDEIYAAAAQLRLLLSKAVPAATIDENEGLARQAFNGRPDNLTFVTLSEATAFWGGLTRVRLAWQDRVTARSRGTDLVLRTAVFRSDPRRIMENEPVVLFRDVKLLALQYFGSLEPNKAPQWQPEWHVRDRLPIAIRVRVEPEPPGPADLDIQVTLHTAAQN